MIGDLLISVVFVIVIEAAIGHLRTAGHLRALADSETRGFERGLRSGFRTGLGLESSTPKTDAPH